MSRKVAVLGGGLSGLSAAWNLAKRRVPAQVVLYEGSSRVGGWLHSNEAPGGGIQELGPRSIRMAKNEQSSWTTLDMLSDVGLRDSILPVLASNKAARRRLIYSDKHGLVEIPSNLSWVFKAKPPFTKPLIWSMINDLIIARKCSGEETIHSFAERRFSKEIAEWLFDPLCRGVYASSTKSLSMKSCFSVLYEAEQKHRSVVKGQMKAKPLPLKDPSNMVRRAISEKWSMYTLKKGLGTLPDKVMEYLQSRGVIVKLNQPIRKLSFKDGLATVETDEDACTYNHVVSCLPSYALSSIMADSQHSPLTEVLDSIRAVTVGVVCLEYEGDDVLPDKFKVAFGYLVPSTQSSRILGVVFDSSTFPEQDRNDKPSTRLTVMLGGEWFEEIFGKAQEVTEEDMAKVAMEELQDQLGIQKQPVDITSRIHKNCIPMYEVGHSKKLELIYDYVSRHDLPLAITGSFFEGVSVNLCVHNAVLATNKVLEGLKR